MRARIVKTCTVVCGPGSEVEISQDQLLALGDAARPATEKPKKPKKPKKAKKAGNKTMSKLDIGGKES